ncbi:MAG: ABC transporter ATP-binding protein/permease [Erysipelotrichaceae bacterium]|nr:ABC transporter ATP-binding protein/permease [Erysipelotrichaceae bacterium]MCI1325816.1 ABC transporter ATP-binding protein/permease [Solobacterium sp.]MCH4044911.1 ABC transporter ATP-binding protein/permease [Erysipelotrichaceae bacterium]MCH4122123.1 ABC transporter ATP-binding protein/permease [Erysipelotrichaceae bacterium]MCI1362615.1 ABC transporter ATP-binding protein/permease [Solobacterium sp.]
MAESYRSQVAEKGFSRRPERGAPVEKAKDARGTLHRLLHYFKAEMPSVLLMTIVSGIGVVAAVLAPSYQSKAIDQIVAGSFGSVNPYLVIMAVLYVIYGFSLLLQGYLSTRLSQKVVQRIRADLFAHMIHLPVPYFDRTSHGDLMSRMTNDADQISTVISTSTSSIFSGVLMLAGTLVMMFICSVPLALLSSCTVIGTILLTAFLSRYMAKYYLLRQNLLGELSGKTEEYISNSQTIAAFQLEDDLDVQFIKTADDLTAACITADNISGSMGPCMNVLNNIGFLIVAVAGAWLAIKGQITVGIISAFIVYSKQFSRPITELSELIGQVQTAIAGAERIFAVLDQQVENPEGEAVTDIQGHVEFRHVNFSYLPGKQVITDFSLDVPAGSKIALVGATGSGKTTIINLLLRFYPIDSGEILLDGRDIRKLNLYDLRRTIGIVLQDTSLFTDTIRNNLTYADSSADDARIKQAAAFANADTMITALKDGYDTVIDASGGSLSQGQRQLLAIARARLSDPEILILDEATSSVDTRTEMRIQNAMISLMENRTSFVIAHRLSTIRNVDQIVVMRDGRIVERGSHEQLLAAKKEYWKLYETQFSGMNT